jgi:contact-dependent growth inhibition (CDI) system CdiI-like immunity protein
MNHEHPHEKKPFDPADFPALKDFFPAYLHQDFGQEYGSASEAVQGFLADASGDEILQVKDEWKLFRESYWGRPLREIQAALEQLGCAWLPESEAQLEDLDEILARAEA